MKKALMSLLVGTAIILGACGGGENSADQESEIETEAGDSSETEGGTTDIDVAAAEKAFQQNCASCHGRDLSGNVGPDLREIGTKYEQEEIVKIIHEGIGAMRPTQATGEEAELIASWLVTKK